MPVLISLGKSFSWHQKSQKVAQSNLVDRPRLYSRVNALSTPSSTPRNAGVVASQTRLDASQTDLCRRPCRVRFSSSTDLASLFCLVHFRCHGRWPSSTNCGNTFMHWDSFLGFWNRPNSIQLNNTQNQKKSILFLNYWKPRVFQKSPGFLGKTPVFSEKTPQINA